MSIALSFGRPRGHQKPKTSKPKWKLVIRNGKPVVRACVTRGYLEKLSAEAAERDAIGIEVASLANGRLAPGVKAHYENPVVQRLLLFRARQTAAAIEAELAEEIYS